MKVIPPITITDAMLTSSTVAEPAAGETAWNAATNYTLGTQVIRTTTHRIYQNLIAGVDATIPENAPTRWLDVGPTMRWAMFDTLRNSATTAATSMTVVLTPGRRIDSIALMGVAGETITVSMTSSPLGTVYSTTESLLARNSASWTNYFFGPFTYQGSTVRFDLPLFTNGVITITVSRVSGNVSLGALVIGQNVDVGRVQSQARSDALNFSTVTRDNFGNATLVQRRTVPKTDQQIVTEPSRIDKLREVRSALNATPAVWSGMDDKATNPNFEALLILGIYKEFSITLDASITNVSLSLEEI
jgi:hypothetical protein